MVAQHQEDGFSKVGCKPRPFLIVKRHAFVVVLRERREHVERLLRDRQHAFLLRR